MIGRMWLATLLAPAFLFGTTASARAAETFETGNWHGLCDAIGCSTWGAGETLAKPGYVLLVETPNERRLVFGAGVRAQRPSQGALRIEISDKAGAVLWSATLPGRANRPSTQAALHDEAEIQRALDALKAGARLKLGLTSDPWPAATIALKDAAPALAWSQARPGVAASPPVVRRPAAPPSARVPPTPPEVAAACESLSEFAVVHLSPDKVLWVSNCSGPTVNDDAKLHMTDAAGRLLPLPAFGDGPAGDDPDLTNVTFDYQTRVLSARFRDNRYGGCGQRRDWVWNGERFALIRDASADCIGMDEADWPTSFRAVVEER
jgi:hypothetical protein